MATHFLNSSAFEPPVTVLEDNLSELRGKDIHVSSSYTQIVKNAGKKRIKCLLLISCSVCMTTVSCFLAFGVMPLMLWIYSLIYANSLQVPFQSIGKYLVFFVSLCIVISQFGKLDTIEVKVTPLMKHPNYSQQSRYHKTHEHLQPGISSCILGIMLGYNQVFGLFSRPQKLYFGYILS